MDANDNLVYAKIKAIHTVNREIRARIDAAMASERDVVLSRVLSIDAKSRTKVEETTKTEKVDRVVKMWRPSVESVAKLHTDSEMNFFNDNIDWWIKGFRDLDDLNDKALAVAHKYTYLDAKKAAPILEHFKCNMELLQVWFGEIETLTHDSTREGLDLIQSKSEDIERMIASLAQEAAAWNKTHSDSCGPAVQCQ